MRGSLVAPSSFSLGTSSYPRASGDALFSCLLALSFPAHGRDSASTGSGVVAVGVRCSGLPIDEPRSLTHHGGTSMLRLLLGDAPERTPTQTKPQGLDPFVRLSAGRMLISGRPCLSMGVPQQACLLMVPLTCMIVVSRLPVPPLR